MSLDRAVFDLLTLGVFAIGVIIAAVRLYQDFTRPLDDAPEDEDDTQPRR